MSKLKLTKGELKRQRDSLGQFLHYLPTLQLKKQQLQVKIAEIQKIYHQKQTDAGQKEKFIAQWVGLLADSCVDLKEWVIPSKVIIETINIAGANIPLLKEVVYQEAKYDFYETPFWYESGIEYLRELFSLLIELEIIKKGIAILKQELRITTQRVNLFEKVKIPECMENIRKIRIYLGDQQANAVGISKVAKKKLEEKEMVLIH